MSNPKLGQIRNHKPEPTWVSTLGAILVIALPFSLLWVYPYLYRFFH